MNIEQSDDRSASEIATKGGSRPSIDPGRAAFGAAVGTFAVIYVFVAIASLRFETVFLRLALLTAAVAAGTFLILRSQEKAWFQRYNDALQEIWAERRRKDAH
jgi:hypothetical protein